MQHNIIVEIIKAMSSKSLLRQSTPTGGLIYGVPCYLETEDGSGRCWNVHLLVPGQAGIVKMFFRI